MHCKTGRWQKCMHLHQQQLEMGQQEAHGGYLCTRKHRAGSSKNQRSMVQNCQGTVRAGNSLGTAGTPHGTGSQEQATRGMRAAPSPWGQAEAGAGHGPGGMRGTGSDAASRWQDMATVMCMATNRCWRVEWGRQGVLFVAACIKSLIKCHEHP